MREKKAMSMKEAREEAQKLLESANDPASADDDEDEAKSNAINGSPSTSAITVRSPDCKVGGGQIGPRRRRRQESRRRRRREGGVGRGSWHLGGMAPLPS